MRYLIAVALAVFTCVSCQNKNAGTDGNKPELLQSHLNDSIHPGDDFFEYANGKWVKNNPIPDDQTQWGIFSLVEDENKNRILKLSEEASATGGKKGSNSQLIGDFFSAGMDSIGIEKAGIGAIENVMSGIKSISTKADLIKQIALLQQIGIGPAYSGSIYQDMKNSEKNMYYLSQGGLGLPDRDYYFNTDEQTTKIRNQYPIHIQKMLTLGINEAAAKTMTPSVLKVENALAKVSRKLEALRVPEKNYNKMAVTDLLKLAPDLNFTEQFNIQGIKVDSVIVCQPEFFTALNGLINTASIDDWKAYLTWQTISSMASNLSSGFDKENFEFYGKLLRGAPAQRPRWKRVLDAQENAIGDALGQLYVKQYFNDKTKKRYVDLTEKIIETYREHLTKLDWMSDSTKKKAIVKLNAITKKIGYANQWKDYSSMDIVRNNYAQNILNANKWASNYEINKLGKPVDRNEWSMTPQTYNAYYNPSNNEIVLPAAIFTAPGYNDEELDDALVYGYVGASTIGHELTHGFDDEGRKFDEKGNLVNWWSKEDEKKFMEKANKLVTQFNKYTLLGDKHPNGEATLGENIADLGGVIIGFDAFKKTEQYKANKKVGGLTPEQRYFLGYAYGWMQTRRPEMQAQLLLTDVHAPIFLRVNGPMSNSDAWYQAFGVTKTHKMWRDSVDRVRIW